ncbi:MAG: N(4)-(beta-N-acetylglucosaminyl)-L-asparaginase [Bacteroidetes bacterium]|nr:N(4)-(beta-N-acetylglucosaminyl)-L-asparaginase [Bacteroidota bacterium]MDA0903679.1 N(4)-(beta-N-acetylglucosaminyl)-L-asparaginase [Bacteroidota bacterium]MDA1242567.1 N(4)-(beta-N-acetylglucosaminyl)-L-asparaginase [Bacteroidota bacterium]
MGNSNRRSFLRNLAATGAAMGLAPWSVRNMVHAAEDNLEPACQPLSEANHEAFIAPVKGMATMVSTWNHGIEANAAGFLALTQGGTAMDMIEAGARVVEADATGLSVGIGGLPDRDGHVTLDACCMDHTGNAGAVCFVQGVLHPLSLARKVMEDTPHVMLAGAGAEQFAREIGVDRIELLTDVSRRAWETWRQTSNYAPVINIENHDTIGLLALDDEGRIAGGCTTSGLAYKMHGRVGDSPIIGAGLFVDPDIGGATATGLGEAVMKTVGSFLVVELMRQGQSPQQACEEAVHRIMCRMPTQDLQVGYLALSTSAETGGHAIHEGFNYALTNHAGASLIDATFG